MQKEKPEIKASDLSKLLAIEWASLPHAEKKRFLDDAKVVKANFHIVSFARLHILVCEQVIDTNVYGSDASRIRLFPPTEWSKEKQSKAFQHAFKRWIIC